MTTKTFKQFLESDDPLGDLSFRLFLQKNVGLDKDEATEIVRWYQQTNGRNVPLAGWTSLLKWADDTHRANTGDDLEQLLGGAVPISLLVKGILAKELRKQRIIEGVRSSDALEDLPFVLAIRKEYGMTRAQAEEVVAWFKNEKDWGDMEHDARDVFIAKWDPNTPDLHHPGLHYSDFVMDEIHMALKKYQLDTRDLV